LRRHFNQYDGYYLRCDEYLRSNAPCKNSIQAAGIVSQNRSAWGRLGLLKKTL